MFDIRDGIPATQSPSLFLLQACVLWQSCVSGFKMLKLFYFIELSCAKSILLDVYTEVWQWLSLTRFRMIARTILRTQSFSGFYAILCACFATATNICPWTHAVGWRTIFERHALHQWCDTEKCVKPQSFKNKQSIPLIGCMPGCAHWLLLFRLLG